MGTKVLKVAVTQGKSILEQKLITERGSVTVGSAASNTLTVSGGDLPASFTLFEIVGGKYCLNFTEQMTGKVNVGGGQLDFETARQQTGVRKRGNEYQMALSEASKGAIDLGVGGVRVIFQFVDAPAVAEPTKLAESTYMPPLQRLDRIFWAALAVSAVMHATGVTVALNTPPPPKSTIAQLPDRFAKLIIKKPKKALPPKEVKKKEPTKDGKDKPKEAEKKEDVKVEKKPAKKPQTSSQKAARREQARNAVKQSAVFKALQIATRGEGGAGVVFQADGDPRTDVSAALAASGGAGIAAADGGPGGPAVRGGSGSGGPVGIGEVGGVAVGGGGGKIGKRKGPRIRVRMTMSKPKIDDGELDGKSVARKIRARKRAFQACYERELKRNPSLKGKLVLEVTVGENGRVADIFVADNALNNAVANCIKGKMRSIRFPKPTGGEATFSYPFIFASSG
ncbi:MAG: AgmX/PglI C-terminal domain-containing protein [Myxococcota bacterium]|nr:AgmX/PglI C-terminal domain-containing protein [Myxococcota bacterium]